jgi:hypothetical protein
VALLRERGFDVWGYEPNAPVENPFVVQRREEISARFDGIFSNNVIEHLIDPKSQFEDYARILQPDGRMVHASPCFAWSHAFTRFHVFFPLVGAAKALADRSGFRLSDLVEEGEFRAGIFERVGDARLSNA